MSQPDPRDEKGGFGSGALGIVLLCVAFAASLAISIKNTLTVERPTKPVLRVAHWQLEAGYRDALQAIIDDFSKIHPEVDIIQMPVTESVYTQWINTQLISHTAPDICEMGQSTMLTKDEGTVRYFLPLSAEIAKPNPFNKGTDLAAIPWKATVLDGMIGGFRDGLQDYYGIPTTMTSMRLFYNKALLARAVVFYNAELDKKRAEKGDDAVKGEPKAVDGPPATFGQWMVQCRAIKALADHTGEPLIPIVSCYGLAGVEAKLNTLLTANLTSTFDADLDGTTTDMETYIAYLNKQWDLETPQIKAVYAMTRQVGEQMQAGFSGMDRQTAQFRFVNAQAGFLWSGSWDASGTFSQAQQKGFDVGVFKVPAPGPGEPNSQFVAAGAGETLSGAGTYGISKNCKNVPLAVEFLQFISSRVENEKFNKLAQWPPLTIGAKPSQLMEPFTADLRGLNNYLRPAFGTRVSGDMDGHLRSFYQGDEDYATFETGYNAMIKDPDRGGDWGWWYLYDQRASDERNSERVLAQTATLDLLDPGSVDISRYRRAVLKQVSKWNGADYLYLFKKCRGFDMPMH